MFKPKMLTDPEWEWFQAEIERGSGVSGAADKDYRRLVFEAAVLMDEMMAIDAPMLLRWRNRFVKEYADNKACVAYDIKGRPSISFNWWLMSPAFLRALFFRLAVDTEIKPKSKRRKVKNGA